MSKKRSAGQIWRPLKLCIEEESFTWIYRDGGAMAWRHVAHILERAYDRYHICAPSPHRELPPSDQRILLSISLPIRTREILGWWAKVKGCTTGHIVRSLVWTAYEDAVALGLWSPKE